MRNLEIQTVPSLTRSLPELNIGEFVNAMETVTTFFKSLQERYEFNGERIEFSDETLNAGEHKSSNNSLRTKETDVPISEKLLLDYKEASSLLSMTEQALRDLVHKGQGPENLRRGKRVCFTPEGLKKYVDGLPREYPYQGIIETITANGAKPMSIEEQRVFGS